MSRYPRWIALLCTLASAGLMLLREFCWPLAWLAPVPLLWLAFSNRSFRTIALCTAAAVVMWALPLVAPIVFASGLAALPRVTLLVGFLALSLIACVTLARIASQKLHPVLALLAFPAAWTAATYLFHLLAGGDTAGLGAYSQVDVPLLVQSAAVTGLWGIEFMLALFAGGLVLILRNRASARYYAAITLGLVSVNLGYGYWRLSAPVGTTIRVAAAAHDLPLAFRPPNADDPAAGVIALYASAALDLAHQGAQVIVFPELTSILPSERRQELLAPLAAAAHSTGASITMGFADLNAAGQLHNVALTFQPDGELRQYIKRHTLVPLDPSIPGAVAGNIGAGRAVAICKDLDFPATIRRDSQSDVRLLLVPAADFEADGWIHARMAILRGVENGFSMVRAARNGVVSVTDDRGRVLARAKSTAHGIASVMATVPYGAADTLYRRCGDWFAWLCLAFTVVVVVLLRR